MQVQELRMFLDCLVPDDELLMFGPDLLTASRAGQVIDCLNLPRLTPPNYSGVPFDYGGSGGHPEDIDAATKKFWNEARGK